MVEATNDAATGPVWRYQKWAPTAGQELEDSMQELTPAIVGNSVVVVMAGPPESPVQARPTPPVVWKGRKLTSFEMTVGAPLLLRRVRAPLPLPLLAPYP